MKSFLLVVNILALTLPFLAAEVQNQEELPCHENDEKLYDQIKVLYILMPSVLNGKPHLEPNYYQHRPAVQIINPYMPYLYYPRRYMLWPHAQISKWQVLPNIPQPAWVHPPHLRPSFIATIPKKDKTTIPTINNIATAEALPKNDKTTIPTISTIETVETLPKNDEIIPTINTIATVELASIPTAEPAVNTVVIPEVSSEFISAPETTTVPVTSPVV